VREDDGECNLRMIQIVRLHHCRLGVHRCNGCDVIFPHDLSCFVMLLCSERERVSLTVWLY